MGVLNGEPKASLCNRHTDQTRIFYRACEMNQWEGSVSKVNEYQLAL